MILSTIGYEGAEVSDFIAVLKAASVDVLVDVRDVPSSRKRGFSKNGLREALEESGIEYLHIKSLGDPKPGRDAARSGKYELFRSIFLEHMTGDVPKAALAQLSVDAKNRHLCLMCFERDHKCCHRNILVEKLHELCNFQVRHLGVPKGYFCKAA